MLNGPIDGTVDALAESKDKGVPIYADELVGGDFSHRQGALRVPGMVPGHPGLRRGEVDQAGPAGFFDLLLSRNGLAAAEFVFIDDALHNVAGAEAAGMSALHFQLSE